MPNEKELGTLALKQLVNVGDEQLGQWEEFSGTGVFHLRRRLSEKEQLLTGPAVDIRGTDEAVDRGLVVQRQCPYVPLEMIFAELNN